MKKISARNIVEPKLKELTYKFLELLIVGVIFIHHCIFSPQVACMQLINALVTSPDDLDFRIHLRNEFLRCGLKKILPVSYQYILLCSRLNIVPT